ncbi:hypothetical protein MJO28_016890 [Puccinia striiformis f. sp. tritici]|nr:hypothetical protein MJO28_016890 [Puccinia striiformis f. sp. tritici]KAI7946003.1 hypothetical protein MJO29_012391 [Puccinia striiformis f. sp. tritici]
MPEQSQLTIQVSWEIVMNKGSQVTFVVQDHVEGLTIRESSQGLLNTPAGTPPSFTLPGKNKYTGSSNSSNGMVPKDGGV